MSFSFVQFLDFNLLVETVEHGKDSKTALDQRPMGICVVNARYHTSASVVLFCSFTSSNGIDHAMLMSGFTAH